MIQAKKEAKIQAEMDTEIQAKKDAEIQAKKDAEIQAKKDAKIQAKKDPKFQAKKDALSILGTIMCFLVVQQGPLGSHRNSVWGLPPTPVTSCWNFLVIGIYCYILVIA